MTEQDVEFALAEPEGEVRTMESADAAYREIWRRIQRVFGSDKEVARVILKGFTGKESFYDLDAADCMDLSWLFLAENRDSLMEELQAHGMEALVPLMRG